MPVLIALLVCLIPTTIGALLSAIGIAGMDRLVQHNVLAMSGRAVEAAGDITTLLLDKTGTITYGNRQASRVVPVPGVPERTLLEAAALSSAADSTPEGRSIVTLAAADGVTPGNPAGATEVPFTPRRPACPAGPGRRCADPQGAAAAVLAWAGDADPAVVAAVDATVAEISDQGGTPLVVGRRDASGAVALLGVVHLKDVVKDGMAARFAELRSMGIRTVMITGDNPRTAKAIAAEAGVDDFLAEATPEDKLALIKREQKAATSSR